MQEESLIRLLVVDDHAVVRQGLCSLLTARYGVKVIGEAANGLEAVEKAQALQPDVILMDLAMPHMTGLEAILRIRENDPHARILVLTSFGEDVKVSAAIRAGAMGYLLKDSGPAELVQAIQQVHQGESSIHPSIARKLLRELSRPSGKAPESETLTERELEVLRLVAQGQSNREISDLLTISEATVRTHVSNILSKLNVGSRTQAALYALREGLVSLNETDPSLTT